MTKSKRRSVSNAKSLIYQRKGTCGAESRAAGPRAGRLRRYGAHSGSDPNCRVKSNPFLAAAMQDSTTVDLSDKVGVWEDFVDIFHAPSEVFGRRRTAGFWAPLLVVALV